MYRKSGIECEHCNLWTHSITSLVWISASLNDEQQCIALGIAKDKCECYAKLFSLILLITFYCESKSISFVHRIGEMNANNSLPPPPRPHLFPTVLQHPRHGHMRHKGENKRLPHS